MSLDGLGDRLKSLRQRNGLSQKDLAKILLVGRSCIRNWEVGVRMPPLEAVTKLARFYHVTTDYLLGMESNQCIQLDFLSEETFEAAAKVAQLLRDECERPKEYKKL